MNDPRYIKDFGFKTCETCKGTGHDDWYDIDCKECLGTGEVEMTMEDYDEWLESKREDLREKN